jgi:peptidyl-prolyl cis-trans isomerase C
VVARVNGAPILRQDLLLQMRRGQGRDAALRALIRQEVLAQEARRRGLARDPRVLRAQQRSLANQMIKRGFKHFTKKDVPRELIEAAYKLNKVRYVHGEMVRVIHIIASATRRHTEDYHRRAIRLARKVRGIAAAGRLSPKEFSEIAPMVDKDDVMIHVVASPTRHIDRDRPWTVPTFTNAAFALKRPGDVSPVIQTRFGYHVIYLVGRVPPLNVTLEQADAEIRDKVFEQARKQAFERWLAQLEQKHRVVLLDLEHLTTSAQGDEQSQGCGEP